MLAFAVLALSLSLVNGGGEDAEGLNYNQLGSDWPGLCQTGTKQSPIDIPYDGRTPFSKPEYEPRFDTLGIVQDTTLFATTSLTHVEVKWSRMHSPMRVTLAASLDGNIFAPLQGYLGEGNMKRVAIEPAQFHFHAPSEASVDGYLFDGVIHIVNFVKDGESEYCDAIKAKGGLGCPVVIGIFLNALPDLWCSPLNSMFKTDNSLLVTKTGEENGVSGPKLFDLDSLLPKIGNIAALEGSLTTAPCTEGVYWISLVNPLDVKPEQITQLRQTVMHAAVPDCGKNSTGLCFLPRVPENNRVTQPLNDRIIRVGNAY